MGARGAVILGFFGALFAAMTMFWQWHVTGQSLAAPFLVFAAIWASALYVMRQPGVGVVPNAKARRAIKWSSIAEGVALCLVANLAIVTGHLPILLPAMALVVGLHFIPIAYAADFPPFYVLGITIVLIAIGGFVLPAPTGGEVAGFLAALILWVAAALALRRDLATRKLLPTTVGQWD